MNKTKLASYLGLPLSIETNKDDLLFHYTNIDAVFSIFKQQNLWFSKSDFLNDPSEIHYIQDVINDVSEELLLNEAGIHFKMELAKLFSKERPLLKHVYILSLTENDDSLTLWSNYSEFIGYNIGLNISSLLTSLQKQKISYKHGKVIYDKNKQREIIMSEVYTAFLYWKQIKQSNYSKKELLLNELYQRMFIYSIFFKKSPFYQEEEYRIALLFPNEAVTNTDKFLFPIRFRTYNEVLIPYIEVPILDQKGLLPIESITIGPKNTIDIATEGLKYFLQINNYDFVKVQKSTIPLRY